MTSPRQLEYRALSLLEAMAAGRPPSEADPYAAVFRSWPGPARSAARRLAAHANAARGRDVLWLIGLQSDGKPMAVKSASAHETLDAWLGKVVPFFDGLAPRVTGFNVPVGAPAGKGPRRQVVALHIDTTRAPFVIRHGGSCEVPWLDGTAIRTAGRLELVKLLSPLEDLPQFEVLESELTFYKNPHAGIASKAAYRWTLDGSLYVMPRAEGRLVIPLHRCRGSVFTPDGAFSSEATDFSLTADKNSPAIRITESAALIEGARTLFRVLLRIDDPCGNSHAEPGVRVVRPRTGRFRPCRDRHGGVASGTRPGGQSGRALEALIVRNMGPGSFPLMKTRKGRAHDAHPFLVFR